MQPAGKNLEIRSKKTWSEMSPGQRGLVVGGAMLQLTLLVIAQRDLSVRPSHEIRGPKWVWRLVTLINLLGPLSYFVFGVRRGGGSEVVSIRQEAAV